MLPLITPAPTPPPVLLPVLQDTDFWGVVIPTWIGAIGGFAATVLAVISLVISLRSRAVADDAEGAVTVIANAAHKAAVDTPKHAPSEWSEWATATTSPTDAERLAEETARADASREEHERLRDFFEAIASALPDRTQPSDPTYQWAPAEPRPPRRWYKGFRR